MNKKIEYGEIIIDGRVISKSWWGKKWCKNIESYQNISSRLERGRTYIRSNRIKSFVISNNKVCAMVKGSEDNVYNVIIDIDSVNEKQYNYVIEKCNNSINNIEELLTGKFQIEFQELFSNNELGLFPKIDEIHYSCNCMDFQKNKHVCKHIAATLYAIGNKLDEDSTIFFMLRGIDIDQFASKVLKFEREYVWKNINEDTERQVLDKDIEKLFGISAIQSDEAEYIDIMKINEQIEKKLIEVKDNTDIKSIEQTNKKESGENKVHDCNKIIQKNKNETHQKEEKAYKTEKIVNLQTNETSNAPKKNKIISFLKSIISKNR